MENVASARFVIAVNKFIFRFNVDMLLYQRGLNKKEMQLNLQNKFSILILINSIFSPNDS